MKIGPDPEPAVPVGIPPELAAAAQRSAAPEGLTMDEWIRRAVGREIARREGVCPACGQPVPPGGSVTR